MNEESEVDPDRRIIIHVNPQGYKLGINNSISLHDYQNVSVLQIALPIHICYIHVHYFYSQILNIFNNSLRSYYYVYFKYSLLVHAEEKRSHVSSHCTTISIVPRVYWPHV